MLFNKWLIPSLAIFGVLSIHPLQASSGVKGNNADYIIVGVGTAGSLMAKRLTDDKQTSVIALHSGKNFTESFIIKYGKNTVFTVLNMFLGSPLPFNIDSFDLSADIEQQFQNLSQLSSNSINSLYETGESIPQVNAGDQEVLWVIPRPEGGGSSVNAGAWCRGTNQLYAQWEAIAGPQWSVNRILGIYKKLEHYYGQTTNPNARGYHGPITIQQNTHVSKLAQVFSKAIINATGFPYVIDYNDPNTPIGVTSQFQLSRSGENGFYRVSSPTAFLNDDVMKSNGTGVKGRKLQVHFESTALKTIWQGNKAVGVEYIQGGVTKQAYAKKGVIVCGGLRSSPFLLSSGVGPASLLGSLGIPVIYDNPNVGQGLADQSHVIALFSSNPADSATKSNGIFSQISWLPAPEGDPTIRKIRIVTLDVIPGFTPASIDLCQPASRGSVSINSANPLAPPVIDLGLLSNSEDLDLYISTFQTYIKNINASLQAMDPYYGLIYPDPAILDDTAALTDFIQNEIGATMHFQSHCRMAPLNQGGVVDSSGRVYGVQNLIIADNSIVPQCMDGSPYASAELIAENIAQILGH